MGFEPQRPQFPSTRWSRILAPGGGRDLDALARSYGKPIEAYLRARLRCSEHDAADAAQEAFAWLLTKGLLDRADPARGRFRGFLKTALKNFAIECLRRRDAEKRGGGVEHESVEAAYDVADTRERSPDDALDDAWRRELLERARLELQHELEGNGREVHWRLFAAFYLSPGERPSHAELAEHNGITRTDVSNWLDYAKRRYRAILRDQVADTVSTPSELQDELDWLFGSSKVAR